MTKTRLLSLSLALVLTGCATTQSGDVTGASIVLPDAYERAAQTDQSLPDLGLWWSGFGDETLDHLVTRALQANHSLEAGLANVQAARAAARVADSAALPTVSASGSASVDTVRA